MGSEIELPTQKTSWADDVDELDKPVQTKVEESVDENGVRIVVEHTVNEDGKKIKITRRIRRVLQKSLVDHEVAERKNWPKFGAERGNKPGPDRSTTTIGEEVFLRLSAGNKTAEPEQTPDQIMKANLAKAGKVVCRLCKGDHYTAKCPYKDTLAGLDEPGALDDSFAPLDGGVSGTAPASTSNKYVPPSMRAGAGGRGESMYRSGSSRDELPTLRVTNVSEDTSEADLRDLFGTFGRVIRVYVGRDRETGAGKGYAFVSFEDRVVAQRAMEKVHGMGYDNLILNCQWSQPREPR